MTDGERKKLKKLARPAAAAILTSWIASRTSSTPPPWGPVRLQFLDTCQRLGWDMHIHQLRHLSATNSSLPGSTCGRSPVGSATAAEEIPHSGSTSAWVAEADQHPVRSAAQGRSTADHEGDQRAVRRHSGTAHRASAVLDDEGLVDRSSRSPNSCRLIAPWGYGDRGQAHCWPGAPDL